MRTHKVLARSRQVSGYIHFGTFVFRGTNPPDTFSDGTFSVKRTGVGLYQIILDDSNILAFAGVSALLLDSNCKVTSVSNVTTNGIASCVIAFTTTVTGAPTTPADLTTGTKGQFHAAAKDSGAT